MCIPNKTHSFTHSILLLIKYVDGGLRLRKLQLKHMYLVFCESNKISRDKAYYSQTFNIKFKA